MNFVRLALEDAGASYDDDQRVEAWRRSVDLRETRLPRFLGYFEQVLPLDVVAGAKRRVCPLVNE